MKRFVVISLLVVSALLGIKTTNAQVSVGVQIGIAPPVLPVYVQPPCPAEGYIWTPGYWAYGPDGYYWVPGVWVLAPEIGFLWTPGYWGFVGGYYHWYGGYWGPHIGFYGGVNYGFGYYGHGFWGGRWDGGVFHYNSGCWNINHSVVHNVYEDRSYARSVPNSSSASSRASFNGPGGVSSSASSSERETMNERHVQATSEQMNHEKSAGADKNQLASVNKGNPHTTAMSQTGGDRFNASGHAMSNPSATTRQTSRNSSNRVSRPSRNSSPTQQRAQRQTRQSARQPSNHNGGARQASPNRGGGMRQSNPNRGGMQPRSAPRSGGGGGHGGGGMSRGSGGGGGGGRGHH